MIYNNYSIQSTGMVLVLQPIMIQAKVMVNKCDHAETPPFIVDVIMEKELKILLSRKQVD